MIDVPPALAARSLSGAHTDPPPSESPLACWHEASLEGGRPLDEVAAYARDERRGPERDRRIAELLVVARGPSLSAVRMTQHQALDAHVSLATGDNAAVRYAEPLT